MDDFRIHDKTSSCLLQTLKWTGIVLLVLALLIFILVFVVFPLVFMNTLSLQRFFVFTNIDQPKNPEYNNYAKYDAKGVRNFYVSVTDLHDPKEIVKLGVWQVVSEDRIEAAEAPGFDFDAEIRNSEKPIIVYFHGQGGTRIFTMPLYNVIRKYFQVIAFDYRSYGDSTGAELSEKAVVHDSQQLYKWVLDKRGNDDIYVWGHSLGTGISTHTLAVLSEDSIVPKGLFLESPFTTLKEESYYHPIAKYFKWLAYFEATFIDPVEKNGFLFKTTTNILKVNCPIMIVHAEDDIMIPSHLGKKLSEVANDERNIELQGKCVFHEVPSRFKCNHLEVYKWPELRSKIEDFLKVCDDFHNAHGY